MTEDRILGYDLYSSALAEILSEPSLNTPITVGLYAKWGSGKSFLLSQLKGIFYYYYFNINQMLICTFILDEMYSFAKLTKLVNLKIDAFTITSVILLSFILSYPFLLWKWFIGLPIVVLLILTAFITIS